VDGLHEDYMAQLGASVVDLLRRQQAAEEKGLLVEVMEVEGALASVRQELASLAERRRLGEL
jgi:hypothetical protein